MIAVDVSNYSGELSASQCQSLKANGVNKVIVQLVNPNILTHRQQIPALLAAGIEVEGYVYVWFDANDRNGGFATGRTQWACDEFRALTVGKMMWLDCEQSMHDTPPFDYIHASTSPTIANCVSAVEQAGLNPGIYTAGWWWGPGVSNSAMWKDLPLWDANYDGVQALTPVNYGGWVKPTMKQYQGTTTFAGVPMVDLNWYESSKTYEQGLKDGRTKGIQEVRAAIDALPK